ELARSGGRFVEDHPEVFGGVLHHGREAGPGAVAETEAFRNHREGEIGRGEAADDEYANLDDVCVADDLHTAEGDQERHDSQYDHDRMEVFAAEEAVDGDGAEVEDGGKIDEDVEQQPEDGHDQRDGLVVAHLQELGHRKDLVLEIDGHE